MAKKCSENLEEILPFIGLNLKNSILIKHTGDIAFIEKTNAKIYSVENMKEIEDCLIEHIPECLGCFFIYYNFLNKKRGGKRTIKEVDSKYLNLFTKPASLTTSQ